MITNTHAFTSARNRDYSPVNKSQQCQRGFYIYYYTFNYSGHSVTTRLGKSRHESLNFMAVVFNIEVKDKWKMRYAIFMAVKMLMLVSLDCNAM